MAVDNLARLKYAAEGMEHVAEWIAEVTDSLQKDEQTELVEDMHGLLASVDQVKASIEMAIVRGGNRLALLLA